MSDLPIQTEGFVDLMEEDGTIVTAEERQIRADVFTGKVKKDDVKNLKIKVLELAAAKRDEDSTEEIVQYILKNYFIYTTRDDIKSEIWIYEDGIYKPNGATLIKEIVREFFKKAYTPQRANKVIAKIEADTGIDTDVFFETSYLGEICVENGILNLETRELSEFTPKKIFFNKLQVQYQEGAKCDAIDKFFCEILKEEDDKKVLYELIGFCLHKDYFAEKAFMFLGNGRNGKGKTLSLIKHFLGIENCASVRLTEMVSGSSSLHELHNRLVNLAGDLSNTSLKDTGLFKELTGRDLVQVKRKYLRDLRFTNYAKMVFACNELPRVYDLSEGFWSRWVLLEFPYKFLPQDEINSRPEEERKYCKIQDQNIISKITTPDELSGLLNVALVGLDRLKKNKDFSYSKGTAQVKDFWIRKSDSFTAFCLDNIKEDIDGKVTKKELRQKFVRYCRKYRVKGSSDKNIRVVLEDMFGVIDGRIDSSLGGDRIWEGITWKSKSQESQGFPETPVNKIPMTLPKKVEVLAFDKKSSYNLDSYPVNRITQTDSEEERALKAFNLEKKPIPAQKSMFNDEELEEVYKK